MIPEHIGRKISYTWAPLVLALILSSPLLFWTFDRGEPVTLHHFDLFPREMYPGQKILRRIEVTRNKRCETEVSILIFDGERTRWVVNEPKIESPGPLHVRDSYSQPMIINPEAAPGPAEMRLTTTRICNPIQNLWPLVSHSPPFFFTILPPR